MSRNKPARIKTFTRSTIIDLLDEWDIMHHEAPKEFENIADYLEEENYNMSGARVIDALIMLIEIGNDAMVGGLPLNIPLDGELLKNWHVSLWEVECSTTEHGQMQVELTLSPEPPIVFIITADHHVVEPNFKQRKRREMARLEESIKLNGELSPAIKSIIDALFAPGYLN